MRFTLRQLEIFTAIGQTGTVSEAAERLSMSQSAASTALGELERQFGRQLFDRVGKRLQLNEIGRGLLPKALEMLDRAEDIEAELSGKGGPGPLRLGATRTIGNYLGPLLISRYWQRYPGVQVKLEIANTTRISGRLAGFELDLALVEGEISNPGLVAMDWLDDELAVFCSKSHPIAGERRVSIHRLLEESWVVREPGSGTRQTLDRAMAPYWTRWRLGLELEHTEVIKAVVGIGRLIGCVSRLALKESFASGELVEIEVPELALSRRFYFLLNRTKFRTPAIAAFLGICNEFAAERAGAAAGRAGA